MRKHGFQICCHPALIKSMLDAESRANEGLDGPDDTEDVDLISQLSDMKIGGGDDDKGVSQCESQQQN